MKKTKLINKKEKTVPVSKSIEVKPVHLPVLVDQPQKKTSLSRGVLLVLLSVLAFLIWTYVFARCFEIYNEDIVGRPSCVFVPQRKAKKNVVAVVGNTEITLDEVKAFVAEVPQLAEVPFEQVYPNILEMMVNDKVVKNGAQRYGIPTDPQVQKMIQMAKDQIISQAFLTKELEKSLTEEDIRAVYDEEIKNFKPEEEIHARHILVTTEKQAQDIMIQLKAGADFALLADQKSIDKNAPGGDLGYFTREMMIPEFAEAVFSMKKGQLSGPIHTAYGWHVVQIEDRRLTKAPSFEQVREQVQHVAMERKVPQILAAERARQNVRILRPTLIPPTTEVTSGQKTSEQ
ncbi:MAG: peptidylprolyl isomerase [Alphaproteobacteria bacterium]|nr:peptidylprolyl isomerase [Alphaproteobacteria bacterium]